MHCNCCLWVQCVIQISLITNECPIRSGILCYASGVVSQYSVPVDNHTAVQIRHTSEVSASDAVYAQVKSDLEKAGLTLVRLLRIDNTDLLEKFRLESDQLKKLKQKDKGQFIGFL